MADISEGEEVLTASTPLNEEQIKLKETRDKIRQEYHEQLNRLGIDTKKGTNKTKKGGVGSSVSSCEFAHLTQNSSLTGCSETVSSSTSGSSSGGSAWSRGLWLTSQIYLKPTQVGFDCFSSISKYPVGDWSGTSETYNKILYIEIRMATSSVEGSGFDSAWASATQIFIAGTESNWTTEYSYGNYKHLTPNLTSGYSYQQLIKIKLANPSKTQAGMWLSWSAQVEFQTLSAPSVSFNQQTNEFTISNYASGTSRCVEFNRNSYTPYSSYLTATERDIFYNCSARNHEWGIYSGQTNAFDNFAIWNVGSYSVKLTYNAGHPSATRTRFSNAVNNWISQMNSAISGSGVSFYRDDTDSTPDIHIETKSNSAMGSTSVIGWDGSPSDGYTYGGLWQNSNNADGWINSAYIQINYETQYYDTFWASVEHLVTEELTEACGCGGDLTTRADCINTDYNWYGKSNGNFNTIDYNIQRFLYCSDIYKCVGYWNEALAVAVNPSNGFTYTYNTKANAYFLTENVTYNMRVWQANTSNHYSVVPAYNSTFTPTQYPSIPSSAVSISSRIEGGFNLTWGASTYKDTYTLAYRQEGTSTWSYKSGITTNSYQITGLQNGYKYWFKVRAVSNYSKPPSDYTSEAAGTVLPCSPSGITIGTVTTNSISVTATGMTGYYDSVEWRVYLGGVLQYTQASANASTTLNSLVHNTSYEIRVYTYLNSINMYSYSYYSKTQSTNLLSVGTPTNVSVVQPILTSYSVDLKYSWGTNATGMDFRWGTDQSTWNNYNNQQNNLYPSANYNVGVGSTGNKYFQVRSVRTDGYNTVYSVWVNASPYPINVVYQLPRLTTPTLTFVKTTKSIACTVGANANAVDFKINLNGGTNYTIVKTGGTHTFDNLTHNTAYTINIYATGDNVNYSNSLTYSSSQTTNLLATPSLPTGVSFTQSGYTQNVVVLFVKGTNATHTDIDMSPTSNQPITEGDWGIVDWINQSGTSYTLPTGYYGVHYFRVKSSNYDGHNRVYSAWSGTYSTDFTSRPSNWEWTTSIVQGGNIYQTDLSNRIFYIITASEWNNFTSKINAFRIYKGLSNYNFTTVVSGTTMTKEIINEAITAITAITGRTINPPTTLVTGDVINKASLYTGLRDSLNSTS